MKKQTIQKLSCILALACLPTLAITACDSKTAAKKEPAAEHPNKTKPAAEHPNKTKPAAEHPNKTKPAEHPRKTEEHPKKN